MSFLRSASQLSRLGLSGTFSSSFRPLIQNRCVVLKASAAPPSVNLNHEEKNACLGRPMSPHLTIYKFQLTSMLSISHRITGLALTAYATGLAGASLSGADISQIAETIHGLPFVVLVTLKYILAVPVSYHLFNGIRHLMWDSGRGLQMKDVYLSGYITLALTVLLSIWLSVK